MKKSSQNKIDKMLLNIDTLKMKNKKIHEKIMNAYSDVDTYIKKVMYVSDNKVEDDKTVEKVKFKKKAKNKSKGK